MWTTKRTGRLAPALLASLLWAPALSKLHAQVLYGALVGNVANASGAAVPDAVVTIVHRETTQSRASTTNDAGAFNFPTAPMQRNPDGPFRGGVFEVTGVTGVGREGIDERVFRFGLRMSF